MKMTKLFTSIALTAGIIASSAVALEWDTLYSRGNWRLDLNFHDNGSKSCESRTVNSSGYVFSLYTWDDADYVIRFSNEDWDFGDDGIDQDFIVEIDNRSPWDISGEKFDTVIQLVVTPPSDSIERFFREIRAGRTLYLRSDDGVEITRFSLRGTTATLNQHVKCERRILTGASSSDPFESSGDSSDPFE